MLQPYPWQFLKLFPQWPRTQVLLWEPTSSLPQCPGKHQQQHQQHQQQHQQTQQQQHLVLMTLMACLGRFRLRLSQQFQLLPWHPLGECLRSRVGATAFCLWLQQQLVPLPPPVAQQLRKVFQCSPQ